MSLPALGNPEEPQKLGCCSVGGFGGFWGGFRVLWFRVLQGLGFGWFRVFGFRGFWAGLEFCG